MNGYGSHTFMWVNAQDEKFWVKYHFKTEQGIENFTDAEAKAMSAEDTDYHRRDLRTAIEKKDYPVWRLEMQTIRSRMCDLPLQPPCGRLRRGRPGRRTGRDPGR